MYKEYAAVFFSVVFATLMIGFPQTGMTAVSDVISLWGLTVVPSLFPFFLCSNFMLGIGFTDKVAGASEKIVRRVFNTSGSCAFAFIMSIVSGYPVGVKILSDLRISGRISKTDGEIGMTFCSTSGPLFMVGAVGAGMMGSSITGWIIALSHYAGAIINGVFYGRILGRQKRRQGTGQCLLFGNIEKETQHNHHFPFLGNSDRKYGADSALISDYRIKDYNSIIGKSIMDSVSTLFLVFGYMVIFMMIIYFIREFFENIGFWIPGLLELSVGCREVAGLLYYTYIQKCIICTAMVSFGGLCVIFQSLSFLGKSDLSLKLFLFSKVTHGIFATGIAYIICKVIRRLKPEVLSVFSNVGSNGNINTGKSGYVYNLLFSGGMVCALAVIFVTIVIIYEVCAYIKKKEVRDK